MVLNNWRNEIGNTFMHSCWKAVEKTTSENIEKDYPTEAQTENRFC